LVKTNTYFLLLSLILSFSVNAFGQNRQPAIGLSAETIGEFDIVIYNESSVIQQFAAQELQHYLEKIFKVKPDIKDKSHLDKNGNYFLLGAGFLIDSLQQPDSLPKDAFVKAFHNGNIYLGGKDDLDAISIKKNFYQKAEKANFGTLYAVYDFLENNLGVHWFFPTYLGEFVPHEKVYSFEEQTDRINPAFEQRTFGKTLYYDKDTIMVWMLRNKVSYLSSPTSYKHNWGKMIPPQKFYDSLPTTFAKKNGKREKFTRNNRPAQLCTTNPQTIQLFVRQSLAYLKQHPKVTEFSLSPNDNKNFCECDNCLKQDTCININPVYSRMSCRIFLFYKTIYDSIINYYPDIHIGGFAYKEYAVETGKNILPKDFNIRLAINNIGFGNSECSTLDTLFMIIRSWKDKPNTGFYSFPYGNTWVYPYLKTDAYQKLINELVNHNFHKIKLYFYPDWYNQGLDIWLITKMYWNPEINIDSLKKVYYQSVYPESYPIVHHFHNILQNNINNLNVCIPNYSLPGIKRTREIFLALFPIELLDKTERSLQSFLAEDMLTMKEKENISIFIKMLDFLKTEQQAFSMHQWRKIGIDKTSLSNSKSKILSLKNSLILSGKSLYWDPVKSPSFYIQN